MWRTARLRDMLMALSMCFCSWNPSKDKRSKNIIFRISLKSLSRKAMPGWRIFNLKINKQKLVFWGSTPTYLKDSKKSMSVVLKMMFKMMKMKKRKTKRTILMMSMIWMLSQIASPIPVSILKEKTILSMEKIF